jgi:C-terminal processing protease CtpA/Prc
MQDGHVTFGIPEVGMLGEDGKLLENQELEPDFKVENDPDSIAAGKDRQLEKAVQVLLEQLRPKKVQP